MPKYEIGLGLELANQRYVNVDGDTMTDDLVLSNSDLWINNSSVPGIYMTNTDMNLWLYADSYDSYIDSRDNALNPAELIITASGVLIDGTVDLSNSLLVGSHEGNNGTIYVDRMSSNNHWEITATSDLALYRNPTENLHAAPKQYVDSGDKAIAASLYLGSGNGTTTASAVIPFNTWAQGSPLGGITYINNGLRVPVAGVYLAMTQILIPGAGQHADIRFGINNVYQSNGPGGGYNSVGTGENYAQVHAHGIYTLAANDYMQVWATSAFNYWGSSALGHSIFTLMRIGNS